MPSPEFATFLKSLKQSLKANYESVEASREGWEAVAARFRCSSAWGKSNTRTASDRW